MESLCTQAIEASIKLQNSAQELKNTARLGEHKEYAEVCENIAYVFGNRLNSARMIHMDLCIRIFLFPKYHINQMIRLLMKSES